MHDPKYKVGDFVRRVSNPDVAGIIREARWDSQAKSWTYRVQLGNALRGLPEEDLEIPPSDSDPWAALLSGSHAGVRAFGELMTYERLRKPPSRITSSFGSAKAAFYPYQFKPLFKFLENPRQRVLVVDDVGLGKTIEAGYIIRELRARHELDRVLVVAPARLRNKWRDELDRRFNESFEIVGAAEIVRVIDRIGRGQELSSFRWITSYESARAKKVLDALEKFQPPIDLVVVDEAHRMRNPETSQHKLGRALSRSADGMVSLTATPVQTGLENLFWLLHILQPEQYTNFEVFAKQAAANRLLMDALANIRSRPPNIEEINSSLSKFASDPTNRGLVQNDFYQSIQSRVAQANTLKRSELIALERDLSELSFTGQVLSRTRKIHVFPDKPERQARVVSVHFSPEERKFYDAIAQLCRSIRPDLSGWGNAMSILMAYRYTASCIPAAIELFRERIDSMQWAAETEDPLSEPERRVSKQSQWRTDVTTQLESVVASLSPPKGKDSKYAAFRSFIDQMWSEDEKAGRSPRKIVVFSYFKRTLRYLSRQLTSGQIDHRVIDGDVPIDEREGRIEDFSDKASVRILLSSEVGSEGLDLQFASVLFNYDLPWNPMVVEQRIGRLDRIGQASSVITILNMVAEETIESRILLKLYERIGVFRETIGDIDPILGEPLERITIELLRGELSAEEAQRRADNAVDVLTRQEREARRLVEDADQLMAADQAFLDEVEHLVGQRKIPAPDELQRFTESFYSKSYSGARIPHELLHTAGYLELPPSVATDLRETLSDSPEALRFARTIEGMKVLATFDQSVALRHSRAELIHARHPLVLLAFRRLNARHLALHRNFIVGLPGASWPEGVVPLTGPYVFGIWLFEIPSLRPRVELTALFSSQDGNVLSADHADNLLAAMLTNAREVPSPPKLSEAFIHSSRDLLTNAAAKSRSELTERELAVSVARLSRQRATLDATLSAKVHAAEQRLAALRRTQANEFAIKMAERRLEKAINERTSTLGGLRDARRFSIEEEQVAVGVLVNLK